MSTGGRVMAYEMQPNKVWRAVAEPAPRAERPPPSGDGLPPRIEGVDGQTPAGARR